MVDATISRVRLRALARLGRSDAAGGRRSRPPPRLRFATSAAHRCCRHRRASAASPQTHQPRPRPRRSR